MNAFPPPLGLYFLIATFALILEIVLGVVWLISRRRTPLTFGREVISRAAQNLKKEKERENRANPALLKISIVSDTKCLEVPYLRGHPPSYPCFAIAKKGERSQFVARFLLHGIRVEVFLATDEEKARQVAAAKIEAWRERHRPPVYALDGAFDGAFDVSEAGNELRHAPAGE